MNLHPHITTHTSRAGREPLQCGFALTDGSETDGLRRIPSTNSGRTQYPVTVRGSNLRCARLRFAARFNPLVPIFIGMTRLRRPGLRRDGARFDDEARATGGEPRPELRMAGIFSGAPRTWMFLRQPAGMYLRRSRKGSRHPERTERASITHFHESRVRCA